MPIDQSKETSRARRRRRPVTALAAILSLATFAGQFAAPAANAAPPGLPPSASTDDPVARAFIDSVGAQAVTNQEALSVFRAWMLGQSGFSDSGYVGSIDDLANNRDHDHVVRSAHAVAVRADR